MHKLLFTFFLSIFAIATGFSQADVKEIVDPKVALMMKRFVELNKSNKSVKGWRIQIFATSDRQKMDNALSQFEALYPNIPADWVHAKPYFKVQVGAFTSKREATRTLYLLKRDYPAAYPITSSDIRIEELLR